MAQAGMPHDFIKRGELSRPRAKHFARSGRDEPIERRLALVEEDDRTTTPCGEAATCRCGSVSIDMLWGGDMA